MKDKKKKITNRRELKSKFMILAATVGLLTGLYGVSAMADSSGPSGNREALIELLANKFNLNQQEVEETFSEYRESHRAERQAEMKARLEERLNQAVSDGEITEDQKNLILSKREEMQNKINEELEDWSGDREERREQMKSYREEMHQWMEDNGIDFEFMGLGHQGGGRGEHKTWK